MAKHPERFTPPAHPAPIEVTDLGRRKGEYVQGGEAAPCPYTRCKVCNGRRDKGQDACTPQT